MEKRRGQVLVNNDRVITLNIGCGDDPFGDIRLDAYTSIYGYKFRQPPDIFADAQFLPFRGRSFSHVKCSHVIEHLENPKLAIQEVCRVCSSTAEIAFPIGDGLKIPALLGLTSLNLKLIVMAIRTRTRHEHKWDIRPEYVENLLDANGFASTLTVRNVSPFLVPFFREGRKGKLLRFLLSFVAIPCDYQVTCKLRMTSNS